jgi:hypothetical protein
MTGNDLWRRGEGRKTLCIAQISEGLKMTRILNLTDRAALSLLNALVVIGLPLVAIGMIANAI